MDFDDLADSYFAFLGSQKAIVDTDRVAGAIQALAPNSDGKVRSRQQQGGGGLAAVTSSQVPALPAIPRTPSRPGMPPTGPTSKSRPPGAVVASFGGVTGPGMRPVGTFAGTTTTGNRHPSAPQGTNPGTGPGSAASNPSAPAFGSSIVGDRPAFAQPRSSGMIYVLVAVLLAAISVLTFLLVSSK